MTAADEPKFACFVRARAHPGRGDDLIAGYEAVRAQVEKESTTELFMLNRAVEDPDLFFCFEIFSSRADFDTHRATALSGSHLDALNEATLEREFVWGLPVWVKESAKES
jgi:quinol monooxygenase YgiN